MRAKVSTRATPWVLETTFGPLEEMFHHIARHGTLDATPGGTLVFRSMANGRDYEVVSAIETYAKIFDIVRMRDPACPRSDALHVIARQLAGGQITSEQLEFALDCLAGLRQYAGKHPLSVISDAARSVALRFHLDASEQREASVHHGAQPGPGA